MKHPNKEIFHTFDSDVSSIEKPALFTFPFYYQPHPLSQMAAKQLQLYIQEQSTIWDHNFGLDKDQAGLVIGKMFGVLVVETHSGELGFLAAFSGKLANANHHTGFVPPVFDMLHENGFFKEEEAVVSQLTHRIEALESNPTYLQLIRDKEDLTNQFTREDQVQRVILKAGKKQRKLERIQAKGQMCEEDYNTIHERHRYESIKQQYEYKQFTAAWHKKRVSVQDKLDEYQKELEALRKERKQRSSSLQWKLFSNYTFMNAHHQPRSVLDIFDGVPPAGAGECAAPKLLQYAYTHHLKPLALAEFWWGQSPSSEIRKHGEFYPACRGKCEPILGHMLQGVDVEPNPIMQDYGLDEALEIIYEDEDMLAVNKPAEFLSVPGRTIRDSIYTRVMAKYPDLEGAVVVHRLDMSTSGILLFAKNAIAHKHLQRQFIQRKVQKRYIALLDGIIHQKSGEISLPLRVDLDNRPHQLVCYEHGKEARTRFECISSEDGKTRVAFYPITGRTHQLRVHAAHPLGLNTAIVGDDLYGRRMDRLHLHAERISFTHPKTLRRMTLVVPPSF